MATVSFTDQSGAKRRPALVISDERFHAQVPDVLVCPVSSQPRFFSHPGPGDVPLTEWKAVGLRYPSTVRVGKLLAVDKGGLTRELGRVSEDTLRAVEDILKTELKLR